MPKYERRYESLAFVDVQCCDPDRRRGPNRLTISSKVAHELGFSAGCTVELRVYTSMPTTTTVIRPFRGYDFLGSCQVVVKEQIDRPRLAGELLSKAKEQGGVIVSAVSVRDKGRIICYKHNDQRLTRSGINSVPVNRADAANADENTGSFVPIPQTA